MSDYDWGWNNEQTVSSTHSCENASEITRKSNASGDLISRRTLYIHLEDMAFEVAPNGKKHGKDEYLIRQTKYETIQRCMEEVQKLPSAEPQIIRCKDCVHWKHSSIRPNYCDVWDWCNQADDFCSFAERKKE